MLKVEVTKDIDGLTRCHVCTDAESTERLLFEATIAVLGIRNGLVSNLKSEDKKANEPFTALLRDVLDADEFKDLPRDGDDYVVGN